MGIGDMKDEQLVNGGLNLPQVAEREREEGGSEDLSVLEKLKTRDNLIYTDLCDLAEMVNKGKSSKEDILGLIRRIQKHFR